MRNSERLRALRTFPALLLLATTLHAKTVLLLPVSGETDRISDLSAVNRLFLDAMEAGYSGSVSSAAPKTGCAERACALEAAKTAGVDEVVYSSMHKLGERWIFSATVVAADGSAPFNQRLTATSIEDMEAVTRRMADALSTRRSVDEAATVDNITKRENDEEPDRRRSLYSGGIALGYLFPAGNSYAYRQREDRIFDPDTYPLQTYSQMIRLTWLNSWEFRNNLALGVEGVWNLPHAVGLDFNLRYLFGRDDFSPFVGGGVGIHYVRADEDGDADKRNSGPALNAQAGMLLFRTYDVNVMLRSQYQVILNSDVDHGIAVDIGVSLKNKDGKGGSKSSSSGELWQGVAAAIVSVILIAMLAN